MNLINQVIAIKNVNIIIIFHIIIMNAHQVMNAPMDLKNLYQIKKNVLIAVVMMILIN